MDDIAIKLLNILPKHERINLIADCFVGLITKANLNKEDSLLALKNHYQKRLNITKNKE